MKTFPKIPLAVAALSATFLVGCTSATMPTAKGYLVRSSSNTEFWAKSVKIHGSWAECQTDSGPVWVSGAMITPKN